MRTQSFTDCIHPSIPGVIYIYMCVCVCVFVCVCVIAIPEGLVGVNDRDPFTRRDGSQERNVAQDGGERHAPGATHRVHGRVVHTNPRG